jgi:hypothetical protein
MGLWDYVLPVPAPPPPPLPVSAPVCALQVIEVDDNTDHDAFAFVSLLSVEDNKVG